MAGTTDAQALLLTMSADTSKALKAIDKLNARLAGVAPEFERHGKKAAKGLERGLGSIDVRKALDKVFDSSKLAVIEEGSTKLRVFGSAIEPLGPLGIAAAAGVVALGAAFEESRKAIEYTDSLYKAAAAAHVSTDALQEYRAAIVKAGGDANAAGPALLAFSETLGKASEGLKGLSPFQALFGKSFGVGDVKALGGTDEALDAVVKKIQNLSSRSQQDAAISQFGLQGLAPLILAGADAWTKYREEAKASGLVLDQGVIRRGHELSVQMDELTGKIKNELTSAFISLGPVLVGLLGLVDKMLAGINKFSGELARDPAIQALIGTSFGLGAAEAVKKFGTSQIAEFGVASTPLTEAQLQAGLGAKKGTGGLADLSKTPQNDFAERADQAQKELDKEQQDLLKAQAALTDNVQQHADLEKLASASARDQIFDQINQAEQKAIQAATEKKITESQRDLLLKQYELAKAVADQVLGEQDALADRKAEWALVDHEVALRKQDVAALEAQYAVTAATADTAAARHDAERHLLALRQAEETKASNLDISRGLETGRYSPDDASRLRSDRDASQSAARQQLDFDQAGPIAKYARSIQDLNTEVQGDAVQAFQSLTSGLVDAALHAKNLGDVAKNVFLELLQQVLTQSLQKEALPGLEQAGAALLHFIPGFAGGTSSTPGGLALVGERGPELVNLPKGAGVMPTFQTLEALSSMKAPRSGGVTVIQPLYLNAEGAMTTAEFMDVVNGHANRAAMSAAQAARAGAVQDVQRASYAGNLNQ